MKIIIKYDVSTLCERILQEQLDKLGLHYNLQGLWEVEIDNSLSVEQYNQLNAALNNYGIEVVENIKGVFVEKIKNAITEMVYSEEKLPASKISFYLAEKMHDSYKHIASVFSEITYTSIENFIIMKKIERVKQLMINEGLTLTEIAYKLSYSSVHHLSNQFKKHTGLTPTLFHKIMNKRRKFSEA